MAYAPFGSPAWNYKKADYKKLNLLTDDVIMEIAKRPPKTDDELKIAAEAIMARSHQLAA